MRSLLLLPALLAALSLGCSGDDDDDSPVPGSFVATIGCSGPGCGLTGALKIPIHEDDCLAAPLLTVSLPAVTTSAADPVVQTLTLERETYCVEAWLDVDEDGMLSTGDAFDSAGGTTEEAGDDTPLLFTLDALEP